MTGRLAPCVACAQTGFSDRVGRGDAPATGPVCSVCEGRGWCRPLPLSSTDKVLAALKADTHEESGWVRPRRKQVGDEVWLKDFRAWIRADGHWVSGFAPDGAHYGFRPDWWSRWRIRRAVRAWAKRRHCHLEGHDAAQYQRKGTRRSYHWSYVAESVTQTRDQCTRCGEGLTPWTDVEGSLRGFTSYSAPESLHERVMYGGGDWSEPRRVEVTT